MSGTKVYRFDPRKLPNVGVFVFVGRTGSGKTVLMEDILSYKRHYFKRAVVMTGSPGAADTFKEHFPLIFIHDRYDEDLLQRLLDKQVFDKHMGKLRPLLVVLDDLGYMAKNIQKSEVIKRIFMAGRHFGILLLFSMQYCKAFDPDLRSQVSYIFTCFEKNPQNRERIYEAYNTIFPNFREYDKVMTQCTQNREVMVMSNDFSQSMAVSDNVFWYKAPYPPLKWKLNEGGSCWRYFERHFDPTYFMHPRQATTGKKGGGKRGAGSGDTDGTLVVQRSHKHKLVR
jgi:hypothetical protein